MPDLLTDIPAPLTPREAFEAARWNESALRQRMLDGLWRDDLTRRITDQIGPIRRNAQGVPDMSANPFRVIHRELSTLYIHPPKVRHDEEEREDVQAFIGPKGKVAQSGLWSSMSRFQMWVLGIREYFMRPHVDEKGILRHRPVPPDRTIAFSSPDKPDIPNVVWEFRIRKRPNNNEGRLMWTVDELDISDPSNPIYRVREATPGAGLGKDMSGTFLEGSQSGANYPYRKKDGTPILPYVLYHAQRMGDRLWDPWWNIETREGSMNLAMLMSFWYHVVKDASWPQRYAVNAVPQGLTTVDEENRATRQEIVTDPATLLIFEIIDRDLGQPVIGQFQAGGDPEELLRAIQSYGRQVGVDAGIDDADLQKTSGDVRSGYAISLSKEGKRRQQERYEEPFRFSDEMLMATDAVLMNRATGSDLPEDGYGVIYTPIPPSAEEIRNREESVLKRQEARLLSRVNGYMELNPGVSEEQALIDLAAIDAEGTTNE